MLHSVNSEIPKERVRWVNNYMSNNLKSVNSDIRDSVTHLPNAGGKRLRPLVFLLIAESLGGDPNKTLPVACSIESLHTSTLIQDDHPDMDNDNMRRGVPTVHREFGRAESQLASNVLLSKSYAWIADADIDHEKKNKCIKEMDCVIQDLCTGQKLDLDYEGNVQITEEEYLNMVSLKTASIYETSSKMAAIIEDESEVENVAKFGYHLGMGFQMIDDIIDIMSSETGKDSFSDVVNKKVTIVTVDALNKDIPVFDEQVPIRKRVQMIRDAGSVKYGREMARDHINKSIEYLNKMDPENPDKINVVKQIANLSINRTY